MMEDSDLSYLLDHGQSLDDIQRLMGEGISAREQRYAVENIVNSGRPLTAEAEALEDIKRDWEEPIKFDDFNLPEFPIHCLPEPIRSYVRELSEELQVPLGSCATVSIGVLSTIFQSRYKVAVRSTSKKWTEQLSLYTLVVAPPAERKTPIKTRLFFPVYEYERRKREQEVQEIAESKAEKELLISEIKALKAILDKTFIGGKGNKKSQDDYDGTKRNYMDKMVQLENFKVKNPFRLTLEDTTPEKLVDILDAQGGMTNIVSSEGGFFDMIQGRYSESLNLDIYLKGYDGECYSLDRVTRGTTIIPEPRLSVTLLAQPVVLQGVMKNAAMRGRGLCGRFLYCIPKSKIGLRDAEPKEVSDSTMQGYTEFITKKLELVYGNDFIDIDCDESDKAKFIYFSEDAKGARLEYEKEVEKRLGNEWAHFQDWAGKHIGRVVRIAALLHCAQCDNPERTFIPVETMRASIEIGEFYASHAVAAYSLMGADEADEDAKYLLKRLEKLGKSEISERDLYKACSKFKTVEAMKPALTVLENRGYIRQVKPEGGKRGRSSKKILVNPHIIRK